MTYTPKRWISLGLGVALLGTAGLSACGGEGGEAASAGEAGEAAVHGEDEDCPEQDEEDISADRVLSHF